MSLEPPLNVMATKPPNCDYEQRAYIKIRSLLGDTNTQIQIDLRKVYGDDTLSDSTIRRWSLLFREGRQSVDDDPRTGRPTTATTQTNIEKIKEIINEDPHITLNSIALRDYSQPSWNEKTLRPMGPSQFDCKPKKDPS